MSISNLINGQATWSNLKINSASIKEDLLIPQYTVLPPPQNGLIVSYDDGSGYELWYSDGSSWAKVSGGAGSGDVVGPALATDSHIALYDGVSGKLIKNSPVEITPTSVNFFTLAPRSSNIPAVSTDLTNKSYVDNAISALSFGDCSTSLVSSTDEYIPVYDGTTGKVLNSSTVKLTGTRFQGFNAVGNPSTIEFNSTTDHLNSDITNVNTVITTNVNTDFIGSASSAIVEFSDKPQSNAPPTVDDDLTNKLYVDTQVSNNVGNFYAGLTDSATISGTTLGSLVPLLGDGTLTVPPNGFSVGDSFHLVVAGTGVFQNGNTLTVRLVNGGTLGSITIDLENANPTSWELEADFTIRSIGLSGSISTNFDFTYQRPSPSFDFRGARQVQTSTINTTVSNTLGIDAQFSGGVNSITASLFYLKKMH